MNSIFTAWNPQPVQQDGLSTMRHAVLAIDRGLPLDPATGQHLAKVFRLYLAGEEDDLTRGFGLRPGQGRAYQSPLRNERVLRRDALVLEALAALGGDSMANRQQLSQQLASGDNTLRRATAVGQLREMHGGGFPLGERQIRRIARGDTGYRRRT